CHRRTTDSGLLHYTRLDGCALRRYTPALVSGGIPVPVFAEAAHMTCRWGPTLSWWSLLLVAGLACSALAGCVHRQLVITSDPPGTIVQINGKTIGPTPVDYPFTYYGTYHIVLIHDGFQTQIINQPVCPPWYERIGVDFFSENVWPWTIRDIRPLHFI